MLAVSFIGGRNRSTRGKPLICHIWSRQPHPHPFSLVGLTYMSMQIVFLMTWHKKVQNITRSDVSIVLGGPILWKNILSWFVLSSIFFRFQWIVIIKYDGKVYSIQHYLIKFVSDFRNVDGLLRGPPVSSTNQTDRHAITEILLKVVLNTITPKPHQTILYFIKNWNNNFILSSFFPDLCKNGNWKNTDQSEST
jgi:hypothetical protein